MGLFSFTQEIAMDLGTANTIITTNGKIVVDEPSVVALDRRTDKMIAVGDKAKMMHEKTHENIRTIRPLRDGVIADFYACEQMIRGLIKMVNNRNRLFSPSLRMVIGVPSGSTEVELRAVLDSAEHVLAAHVFLNIGSQVVTGNADGVVTYDTSQRDNGNFRRSTTYIDNHVSFRSFHVDADTDCRSHRFENQINITTAGMFRRVTDSTEFNFRTSRRNANHHAKRR